VSAIKEPQITNKVLGKMNMRDIHFDLFIFSPPTPAPYPPLQKR
jgi:hypothetical protein